LYKTSIGHVCVLVVILKKDYITPVFEALSVLQFNCCSSSVWISKNKTITVWQNTKLPHVWLCYFFVVFSDRPQVII